MWLDACQGCVEGQLAHRNAHAICTQVSQSKNSFHISYNNGTNIRFRPENNLKNLDIK
jgi:hypothetical protein